jgi:hypothetical protein
MNKQRDYVLRNEKVCVGLEDSKKTWTLCVRSGGIIVHETSMPAQYEVLRNYFHNKCPECQIRVMYEAGFRGFELHDQLVGDEWECVVPPPHTVTQEKCQRQKNDRTDCRRLAKNLENGDYRTCFVPDKGLREDRQISRTCGQVQADLTRVCSRIRRMLEFHGLDNGLPAGRWSGTAYARLRQDLAKIEISDSLRFSFEVMFRELENLRQLKRELLLQLRKLAEHSAVEANNKVLANRMLTETISGSNILTGSICPKRLKQYIYRIQMEEVIMQLPEYVSKNEVQLACKELGIRDWSKLRKPDISEKEASVIMQMLNTKGMNIPLEDFKRGLEVELEHGIMYEDANVTNNHPILTGKIVLAHLKETLDYYKRLEVIEIEGDLLKAIIAKDQSKIESKYKKLIEAQHLLNKAVSDQLQ